MNELQQILQEFERGQQAGQQAALATVVQTSGSAYRRPGARMLLTAEGQTIGAISGGCLESDVRERFRSRAGEGGAPILVRYDATASDDIVFGLGLGCNGIVDVLLESLSNDAAASQLFFIQDCWQGQQAGAIATVFGAAGELGVPVGARLMLKSDGTAIDRLANSEVAQRIAADTGQALLKNQTRVQSYALPQGQIDVLIETIQPPLPLLIFGAGYDVIPVVQFAKQLGWHVTVIDRRPEYLTSDRFPQADRLLCCPPDRPDSYHHLLTAQTVAVVMTHHYASDLVFLQTLIPSPLRYLGVLGPQRRMQQLWQDLAERQVMSTSDKQQRLYNPVGLDIAAETPAEIALSIVAEIQAVLGGRAGGFLRDRAGSIHDPWEQPCLMLAS